MAKRIEQTIINKEDAVFWLDANGRWHNDHGQFENRKIIRFFHTHIRHDKGGYHVAQRHGDRLEKVYFRFEDTALFVFDVDPKPPVTLVLNTGATMRLMPRKLVISGDDLYMDRNEKRIKFVDRGLLKISQFLAYENNRYYIRFGGRRYRILEAAAE